VKLEDGSQEEKNNIFPYVYGSYKSKRRGSSNGADSRFSIAISPLFFLKKSPMKNQYLNAHLKISLKGKMRK
jgi:hypothetical protein